MRREDAEPGQRRVEELAAKKARRQTSSARWNVNTVIFSYAVLATVILLRLEGIATQIVAAVAVSGLTTTWLIGLIRGKRLYQRIYDQELDELREAHQAERDEALTKCPLTQRETVILSHIASGYINKEIAFMLGISPQTTKNHVSNILRKLDVSDRTRAVVLAMQHGWVSPNGKDNGATSRLVENSPSQYSSRV